MLEHIERLPVEVVERFLEDRDHKKVGIPENVANYILQINEAFNLNKKYRSITECARQLRKKYPELSLPTCKQRVYDSINFFNADCSVTAPAWDNYYADRFESLADINLIAHNFSEARRCFELAHKYRSRAAANVIDPKRTQFKPQIVSADMKLERMGIQPKGILEAYRRGKTIIHIQDIPSADKQRMDDELRRELDIKDVDHEEA